jgi:hypothetical protein
MAQQYPSPENQQPKWEHRGGGRPWILGLVLVLVGGYLLLDNLNILPAFFQINNWWALFILIPAIGSLYRSWQDYQENGRLTRAGRGSLFGGFILLAITGIFLFNFNWEMVWPVLLIIAGLGVLAGGFLRD